MGSDPQAAATFYLRVKPKVKRSDEMLRGKKFDLNEVVKGSDYPDLDLLPADFLTATWICCSVRTKSPRCAC